jgi:hypothetical protein
MPRCLPRETGQAAEPVELIMLARFMAATEESRALRTAPAFAKAISQSKARDNELLRQTNPCSTIEPPRNELGVPRHDRVNHEKDDDKRC